MKMLTKLGITTAMAAGAFMLLTGCGGESAAPAAQAGQVKTKEVVKPVLSDRQLSYRNTSLEDETVVVPPEVKYTDAAPGAAKRFKRAYQDAPPMIPHSVEGLVPIKKGNNQCLGCHMPDVAPAVGATPIPPSHFTNFRPKTYILHGELYKNGHPIKNTSDENLANVSIKPMKTLYMGRYNCTQCHAPQAKLNPLVENKFQAQYTDPNGAFRSSWHGKKYLEHIKIPQ